jgi:hypothetical protein
MKSVIIDGRKFVKGYIPCMSCKRRIFYTLVPEVFLFYIGPDALCHRCDPARITLGIDFASPLFLKWEAPKEDWE